MYQLLVNTSNDWLDCVIKQFDLFLKDHAACEKKASAMAMNMIAHYPDKPLLVQSLTDLAVEELSHYREVIRLLHARGLNPGGDEKDAYVNSFRKAIRQGPEEFLMDRLLIASIIEARGFERFALVADALSPGIEKTFFKAISQSEDRHHQLFLDLARLYCNEQAVMVRLDELLMIEADIVKGLPIRAALH